MKIFRFSRIKQVLYGPDTWRWVFYNPETNLQVAVLTWVPLGEGAEEQGYLPLSKNLNHFTLSIPIEGMGGWHVRCSSLEEAWKIANLECSRGGKFVNRFWNYPWWFVQDKVF